MELVLRLGKIVNNFVCYIVVFLNSEEAHNAVMDKEVKLRLADTSEIDASVEQIVEQEDGNVMIIFRINKAVEYLMSYRKISVDVIWWSYEGLKVINSAIVEDGAETSVVRNRSGYKDKILVKVLKQNKNYSIIRNYTTEELLELGYDKSEIWNMKGIVLYDEIIVNPKI